MNERYIREGREAHQQHKHRADNPYLAQARLWDEGWRNRQIEELEKSGNVTSPHKFVDWLAGR